VTRLRPDTDLGAPTIGVTNPWSLTLPAEVGKALVGAAATAVPPLVGGDTIRAIDDRPVTTYAELIAALAGAIDRPVSLSISASKSARLEATHNLHPVDGTVAWASKSAPSDNSTSRRLSSDERKSSSAARSVASETLASFSSSGSVISSLTGPA
jgi:membrane-associated protease RseP (regulator of RpoE activity)